MVLNHKNKLRTLDVDGLVHVKVIYDPYPDGNCQFEAVAHQFAQQQIYTSVSNLRRVAVEHIRSHRNIYANFLHEDFYEYIKQMKINGTYRTI